MKALTVQQPWASALVAGIKPVENRTQNWSHRGPLAIHAGKRLSDRGMDSPLIREWWNAMMTNTSLNEVSWPMGAIIGAVNLVDVHVAHPGCCESPWAEEQYVEHGTGKVRKALTHLVCEEPVEFANPIPCIGALGLWDVPEVLLDPFWAEVRLAAA